MPLVSVWKLQTRRLSVSRRVSRLSVQVAVTIIVRGHGVNVNKRAMREGMKHRRAVHRRPSAPQSLHARLHCACEVFYGILIALSSREWFHPSSSQSRPPSTQSAACSRKSLEHFASNVRASSAGPAKLDIIRGHQSVPHTRAGEAAARLEKCGQSMSTSA